MERNEAFDELIDVLTEAQRELQSRQWEGDLFTKALDLRIRLGDAAFAYRRACVEEIIACRKVTA